MEQNNHPFQQAEGLLIRYLTGSASAEEREEALNWIHAHVDHQKFFDELKDYYTLTKLSHKDSGYNVQEGWERVKSGYLRATGSTENTNTDLKATRKMPWLVWSSAVAAIAVIAFLSGFYLNKYQAGSSGSSSIVYNEIKVPLGAKSQVKLSDGTNVWLNAGSSLRYPSQFIGKTREVFLDGEAYFDVAKMKEKQFIVRTSHINVKVFGTQFNISSYPEESQIKTTLAHGSVAIETNNGKQKSDDIFLQPNQTAVYFKPEVSGQDEEKRKILRSFDKNVQEFGDIMVIKQIDPVIVNSWKDNRWVIVGEELGKLAVKLERRYNVKISFESGSLRNYKFSGTLSEETFEQVLKIIQLSAPIVFKIENNKVIFKEDKLYRKKYDTMITNPQ